MFLKQYSSWFILMNRYQSLLCVCCTDTVNCQVYGLYGCHVRSGGICKGRGKESNSALRRPYFLKSICCVICLWSRSKHHILILSRLNPERTSSVCSFQWAGLQAEGLSEQWDCSSFVCACLHIYCSIFSINERIYLGFMAFVFYMIFNLFCV